MFVRYTLVVEENNLLTPYHGSPFVLVIRSQHPLCDPSPLATLLL